MIKMSRKRPKANLHFKLIHLVVGIFFSVVLLRLSHAYSSTNWLCWQSALVCKDETDLALSTSTTKPAYLKQVLG